MPVYKVQAPDGRIMTIEAPEGATEEQVYQFASEQYKTLPKAEPKPAEAAPVEEKGFMQKVSDMVTGDDRATAETEQGFSLPDVFSAKGAKVALGLLSTFDEQAQAEIIAENYPGVVFDKDEKGNLIVDARAIGGGRGALNQPGIDKRDVNRVLYQMSLFTPAGRAGAGAATIPAAMKRVGLASAGTQALNEAATEFAGGNRETMDQLQDVAIAGVAGGMFEGVIQKFGQAWPAVRQAIFNNRIDDNTRTIFKAQAQKLGINADDVTDDFIREFSRRADDATGEQFQTALEREFKVNLTRGQKSGKEAALVEEDALRSGMRGQKAQDIMLDKEAIQTDQITKAASNIQDDIAKNAPVISSRQEAGASLREGVRRAEEFASSQVNDAYSAVGDAALTPEGLKSVMKNTRNSMRGVEFDKTLPQTKKMLDGVKSMERLLSGMEGKIKPIHIKQIEQYRRRLNTAINSAKRNDPSDFRQVTIMKSQFDESLDEAIMNGLFTGDERAMAALKSARELNADYMKKFGMGRDTRGAEDKFIKRIIESNPTDEEVINSLFTAGTFSKSAASNLAKKYKQILGPDSEEWNMVRQVAFKNLVKTNKFKGQDIISGQKTLKAFSDAWEKNSSLMRELFTPEELGKIKRFAALVKRSQPDLVKSRLNPSGTSQGLTRMLSSLVPFLDTGVQIASSGAGVIMREGAKRSAKNAFRPFQKVIERSAAEQVAGDAITAGAVGLSQ